MAVPSNMDSAFAGELRESLRPTRGSNRTMAGPSRRPPPGVAAFASLAATALARRHLVLQALSPSDAPAAPSVDGWVGDEVPPPPWQASAEEGDALEGDVLEDDVLEDDELRRAIVRILLSGAEAHGIRIGER